MNILPNKPFSIGLVAVGRRDWIGGGLYIQHIFESLLAWRSAHPEFPLRIYIVCSDSTQLVSDSPVYSQADGFILASKPSIILKVLRKTLSLVSKAFPCIRIPFIHCFGFFKNNLDFLYPFASSTNPLLRTRSAAWIPDFQHKYLPHYFSSAEILIRDNDLAEISRTSTDIVFSSNHSLLSFKKFYPRSSATLHVLPFCSVPPACLWEQHSDIIRLRYNLPPKFLLCPGQFWIHKNQSLVLRALSSLINECEGLFVVFTGHTYDYRYPACFDEFLQLSHLLAVRSSIATLGMIPRIDQLQLMRSSVAVIQPSLFEGWSTVVEDARALGKKIILSDLDVHAEQHHPDALFFARSSVESLVSVLRDTWNNSLPGPDAYMENLSRIKTSQLVMDMGERFMSIARGA